MDEDADEDRERRRLAALDASRAEFERLVEEERRRRPRRVPLGVPLGTDATTPAETDPA